MSIGITHAELDYLTLAELNERIVGYNQRTNIYWQRFARVMSPFITALSGKHIRPNQLLPEVFPDIPPLTKKDKMKELEAIKKAVGLK